jgi:hypothetical protein
MQPELWIRVASIAYRAALQMRCKMGTPIVPSWPQLTLICNG